jgi:hypothetical protein
MPAALAVAALPDSALLNPFATYNKARLSSLILFCSVFSFLLWL